ACCDKENPILYRKTRNNRIIENANFNPSFKENLFFIYLGHKQNTSKAIQYYRSNIKDINSHINKINSVCLSILKSNSLIEFEKLIIKHEEIISNAIKIEPIQKRLFKDYKYGVVKSLGAWGGDFILVSGDKSKMEYFKNKGYKDIIPYKDLVY
ncbi:MAG: GHMP kinase, partial [Bacteroidota bacterium]|nr:GHMP kinase [Bacteroidota bacterium]